MKLNIICELSYFNDYFYISDDFKFYKLKKRSLPCSPMINYKKYCEEDYFIRLGGDRMIGGLVDKLNAMNELKERPAMMHYIRGKINLLSNPSIKYEDKIAAHNAFGRAIVRLAMGKYNVECFSKLYFEYQEKLYGANNGKKDY